METFRCMLDCLVPLRMWELRNVPDTDLVELARSGVDIITAHGDDLQFGGKGRHQALGAVVTGIATMALLRPEGVDAFGGHWCQDCTCTRTHTIS